MIITYDGTVSEEIKKVVEPRINVVSHLFPIWCHKLVVYWESHSKEEGLLAVCDPKHEYRTMSVTLYPLFLEAGDWEDVLIHEIQHGLLRPLITKMDRIVEKFVKDETLTEWILDELAEAEEAVCEDLTIFARKLRD